LPGTYRVETRPQVRKDLRKLNEPTRSDVLSAIRALALDPRPADIGLIDTTDRYGLEHDFHAVPEGILRTGHHGQMPAAR
jgi:hypothetical protein